MIFTGIELLFRILCDGHVMSVTADAVYKLGELRQTDKLLEEMDELGQALLKYRYDGREYGHVAEETADVLITLVEQLHIHGEDFLAMVATWIEDKIALLEDDLNGI